MIFQHSFSDHRIVQMSVNFGSGNAFVPKHHLDGTKVGSVFQQMCSKRMSESMRTDFFANSGFFGQLFDDGKNHHSRKFFSSSVQEKIIFKAFLNGNMHPNFVSINIDEFNETKFG